MGAVNECPDNGRSVQAGTPTQDFLAYATKKKVVALFRQHNKE